MEWPSGKPMLARQMDQDVMADQVGNPEVERLRAECERLALENAALRRKLGEHGIDAGNMAPVPETRVTAELRADAQV